MKKIDKMRQKFSVPKILNLIYPPVCGICGKLNNNFLCKKCEKALESEAVFGVNDIIKKENNIKDINKEFNKIFDKEFNKYFDEHLYIFKYEGIVRKAILKYKFQEEAYLYKTFVNFLLKNKNFFEKIKKYDTIIPVPISKKRFKLRGYNQSELIGKEIAKKLNINIETECLFKMKNITEQSKLSKEEKLKNIQGVYKLNNNEKQKDRKILLVDDIYTTGSTVNECCKILKEANPKKIGVFTLAKD